MTNRFKIGETTPYLLHYNRSFFHYSDNFSINFSIIHYGRKLLLEFVNMHTLRNIFYSFPSLKIFNIQVEIEIIKKQLDVELYKIFMCNHKKFSYKTFLFLKKL